MKAALRSSTVEIRPHAEQPVELFNLFISAAEGAVCVHVCFRVGFFFTLFFPLISLSQNFEVSGGINCFMVPPINTGTICIDASNIGTKDCYSRDSPSGPSGTVKMCLNIVEHRESHKGVGSVPQACLVLRVPPALQRPGRHTVKVQNESV